MRSLGIEPTIKLVNHAKVDKLIEKGDLAFLCQVTEGNDGNM